MDSTRNGNGNGQSEPIAASEYPVSVDALMPTMGFGPIENDAMPAGFDPQANVPPAIRHNSINRYTLSTRTIAHYCRLEQIGEGTYGQRSSGVVEVVEMLVDRTWSDVAVGRVMRLSRLGKKAMDDSEATPLEGRGVAGSRLG